MRTNSSHLSHNFPPITLLTPLPRSHYEDQCHANTSITPHVHLSPPSPLTHSSRSDCDGVIWRGDSVLPGIASTLASLRAAGKKCYFVTNNSTKSRKGYKKKFDGLGLDVPAEEIFSSSFAAAAYLQQTEFLEKKRGKKVYVLGEVGICEELDLIGVPWIGGPSDAGKEADMSPGSALPFDKDVGAVIVGFDRTVNYFKIQTAQLCINENEDCEFIATNLDAVTHLTDAQEWAGNGAMVGAIKGCTGQVRRRALSKRREHACCPLVRPTSSPSAHIVLFSCSHRVRGPGADRCGQTRAAHDRLRHEAAGPVRRFPNRHDRRPSRHGHRLRKGQRAEDMPGALGSHLGGEASLPRQQGRA